MNRTDTTHRFREDQRNYLYPQIVLWSALLIVSFLWNLYRAQQNNIDKARVEARTLYELTLAYRGWAASHGGVYVPITDTFKPNPYLQVPDRDVVTKSGKQLTLVNPAWMTRQVFERLEKQSELPIVNHLMSLKNLNPNNKTDAWEEKGLRAFEQGADEVSEAVTLNGRQYMRMLKPFKVEKGCLKCHGHQGYREGDIRGGISIAIPLQPYFATATAETLSLFITHAVLWSIGIAGIFIFTGRMRKQQLELINSEEKYRILFQSNPHPMWVYDMETLSFLTVNDAAVQHYGYTREEFLGMTIKDIRPSEDVERLLDSVHTVTEGVEHAGVWKHRKKDGSVIFVDITTHVLDFSGRRAKLVLADDVSERRQLEDQLRHSQKMEAVGKLAGGVAHDFNNILTAIIGYGSLLQMKMPPVEPLRHNVDEIISAARRGANLTQSLLAFSRKQITNPMPVNVNLVVARIEKLIQRLMGENVRLELKLSANDLVVFVDSGQFEQVLMNLATNARDAMPDGGILSIATSRVELDNDFIQRHTYGKSGAYALIAITDNGMGMDAKTAERIFEPFFTTKDVGRGTGLGLSIVYGIVRQNNGYVSVDSEPGRGTTFKLYLPLVARIPEVAVASGAELPKRGSEVVLVAEDDAALRQLAKTVLEEFGYTVIEAVDGEDAIEKARQNKERIQLLLLDVMMPKKNGKEVHDAVIKLMPSVKTLFLSGYTADLVHRQGMLGEGQGFIAKPVSPSELLKRIREVLDAPPGS